MAKIKKIDYTELSTEELLDRVEEEQVRLQRMRFNHAIVPVENPNIFGSIRRDIARMKTELRRRELQA